MFTLEKETKPLRSVVLQRLHQILPGRNLVTLALEHHVPVKFGSKKNKGWVGQTIEKVGGLDINNNAGPDGLDFELKTTEVRWGGAHWVPKETLKITQLNPSQILEEEFEQSVFWKKLSALIVVTYETISEDVVQTQKISSIDIKNEKVVNEIREFWEDVRHAVCSGEMKELINLGTSAGLIQLRPLGDGRQKSRCPITGESFPARAFYATKKLINLLLNEESL